MEKTDQMTNLDYLKVTCGDSTAMMAKIIEMFLDTTPEQLQALNKHVAENDWESTYKMAHKVKSSFNTFGIKTTGEMLERIETLAKTEPNKAEILVLLGKIDQESVMAFAELKTALSELN